MHGGARIRLLEFLAAAAPDASVGISEIAELIGVDQPRASRLVADSVGRGFVSREVDPRDARKSVISITDAGRAMLDQIRTGRRSAVTDALAGFSDEETAQLAALLTRFVQGLPKP
jgi:DNA-binding MarR family transcriptional regulator